MNTVEPLQQITEKTGRYRLWTKDETLIVADFDRQSIWRIPGPRANPNRLIGTDFVMDHAVVGERSEWRVGSHMDRYRSTRISRIERFPHSMDRAARRELEALIAQREAWGRMDDRGQNLVLNSQYFRVEGQLIDESAASVLYQMRNYSDRLWLQGPWLVNHSIDALLIGQLYDRSSDQELLQWQSIGPHKDLGTPYPLVETVDFNAPEERARWFRIVTADAAVFRYHPSSATVRLVVDPEWGRVDFPEGRVESVDRITVGAPMTWELTGGRWVTQPVAFVEEMTIFEVS